MYNKHKKTILDEDYRSRGSGSRFAKRMRKAFKQMQREKKIRDAMPVPQEYLDHVGGPIVVTTFGFGEDVASFREFTQSGYLLEIDIESKYVSWHSNGHVMPPVHIDNIKLGTGVDIIDQVLSEGVRPEDMYEVLPSQHRRL